MGYRAYGPLCVSMLAVFGCNTHEPKASSISYVSSLLKGVSEVLKQGNDKRRASGTVSEKLSWRGVIFATNLCEDAPAYDPVINWDSRYYHYYDQPTFRSRYVISDKSDYDRIDADMHIFSGEDTFLSHVYDRGDLATEGSPEDVIVLFSANRPEIHWMKHSPVRLQDCLERDSAGKRALPPPSNAEGRYVSFADGESWLIADSAAADNALLKLATYAGAKERDREVVLGPFRKLRYRPETDN